MKQVTNITLQVQKGFSLLEISIAMAISGVFVVAYMETNVKDLQQAQVSSEAGWVIDVVKNIQQGFTTEASFAGLNTPYLVNINSIPKNYITGSGATTSVSNGSGGKLYVAGRSLGAVGNALALTYTGLSKENCSSLISEFESTSRQKATSLFALIGSNEVRTSVPTIGWDATNRWAVADGTDIALKKSTDSQLDVAAVAKFCKQGTSLKTITLIRMWVL